MEESQETAEVAAEGVQPEGPAGIQGVPAPEPVETPETEAEVQESELRSGHKEAANNPDDMAIVEGASEEVEEKAMPSFFIEPEDRQRIEVDILCDPKNGKILSISKVGMGLDFEDYKYLTHSIEWLEFSPPSYDNMATYRSNSTTFRPNGQSAVDRTTMRNFLLVRHLKDWSFRDRNGEKVELSHKDNGALDDDSIKKVYSVPPTIIDVILTIFEKDILLT
jgi:hypothetical protein